MKIIKRIGIAFLCIVLTMVMVLLMMQLFIPKSAKANPFMTKDGQKPLIIAHRGAKKLWPENTIVAFDNSVLLGVNALEMDICITKDDVLITHHNLTIDKTTNLSGAVRGYTFQELSAINFGEKFKALDGSYPYQSTFARIATVKELFEKYGNTQKFMVEIKDKGSDGAAAAKALWNLIKQYNVANNIAVCSFDEFTLQVFRKESGGKVFTSSTTETTKAVVFHGLTFTDALYKCPDQLMSIPTTYKGYEWLDLTSKRVIHTAHRRNMAVTYWTVNDKDTMKMLIERGADGIITDRPDLMKEVLAEMGYAQT